MAPATSHPSASAETPPASTSKPAPASASASASASTASSWITAPQFIVRLFTRFPLATFEPNALPCNTPAVSDTHASLFVFAEAPNRLSYNPTCLKWQAYLRFARFDYVSLPSTNHASPSGSLPFLLPADTRVAVPCTDPATLPLPMPSAPPPPPPRSTTYAALLDASLRPAWLHALYLAPANTPLLRQLYIAPVSASSGVQTASLRGLRRAAASAVAAAAATGPSALSSAGAAAALQADALYADARAALAALEAELARSTSGWFFDALRPTAFDAAVFAYVHLLLDESLVWGDDTLPCAVASFMRLVAHRDRVLDEYWPGEERRALQG
ncbi:uncharacterized protein BROUX77_003304 [Berkeleyomyces rouxiae]|uniref:uncharacterized protein n=1 Tax=Berkeleyomyces rouxiae TaxID=2035830 RepID=UPI003B7F1182